MPIHGEVETVVAAARHTQRRQGIDHGDAQGQEALRHQPLGKIGIEVLSLGSPREGLPQLGIDLDNGGNQEYGKARPLGKDLGPQFGG
jgi:hypothetical protein